MPLDNPFACTNAPRFGTHDKGAPDAPIILLIGGSRQIYCIKL